MNGDRDVYKIAKFDNIFLIFVIEISHGKVFFFQILKWRTFSSPLKLKGTFQGQGISVSSLHHCTVLTASDKHLEILFIQSKQRLIADV